MLKYFNRFYTRFQAQVNTAAALLVFGTIFHKPLKLIFIESQQEDYITKGKFKTQVYVKGLRIFLLFSFISKCIHKIRNCSKCTCLIRFEMLSLRYFVGFPFCFFTSLYFLTVKCNTTHQELFSYY